MATLDLELVPLRSKFPYAGHLTVRHSMPVMGPVDALDPIAEDVMDILDYLETTTAPQVVDESTDETAVRKGVGAR